MQHAGRNCAVGEVGSSLRFEQPGTTRRHTLNKKSIAETDAEHWEDEYSR